MAHPLVCFVLSYFSTPFKQHTDGRVLTMAPFVRFAGSLWRGLPLCPPFALRRRHITQMSASGNGEDGTHVSSGERQPDDLTQVQFGSDTSSLRLPQDAEAHIFQGLKVAVRDDASSISSSTNLTARASVADALSKLPDSPQDVLVDSLHTLTQRVNLLSESEALQAWDVSSEVLSIDKSPVVRAAAYDLYIALCVQYQHNTEVVYQWLHKFGDPSQRENKEKLVKFKIQNDVGSYREVSLAHLLTTLLVAWHDKAEKARKQADHGRRNSKRSKEAGDRPITLHEEEKLQELFDYCKAYVNLQDQSFSVDDSVFWGKSISAVCKAATARKHIENSLDLLESTLPKTRFPLPTLRIIAEVLCTIVIQIRDLTSRSQDLISRLARDQYQAEINNSLLAFVHSIKSADPSQRIESTIAQGALLTMSHFLFDGEPRDPRFLRIQDVIASCSSAIGKGHSKLDGQILTLLAQVLRTTDFANLRDRSWVHVLKILRTTVSDNPDANIPPRAYTVLDKLCNQEKVEAPKKDDPAYSDYLLADKLRAVIKVNKVVEGKFGNLGKDQVEEFYEYLMGLEVRFAAYSPRLFVRYFLRSVNTNAERASLTYNKILEIASSTVCQPVSRLECLRLLCRVRCDSANRLWITVDTDCGHTAAAVHRQQADDEGRLEGIEGNIGSSSSNMPRDVWMYPDPAGLPENPPTEPSSLVFTSSYEDTESLSEDIKVLDMKRWLETAMGILIAKDDWELYTYLVVHFGTQLSNMQLFKNAEAGIKFLKNKIVEIIYNASFMDSPPHSGLKKSNVAVCFYNILTVLIPYGIYSKDEQDQIVSSFVRGLSSLEGTAQCCIHALLICSLEMPAAFDKFLGQMLGEMQRIITQPQLSMHVLEFLSGFARNPHLRSGIQKDEIKSIFGICLTYLNIARDAKAKTSENPNRLSSPAARRSMTPKTEEPNTLDRTDAAKDFPDYVFALTFHVMNFWFLSLKLPDRVVHVGWLIKRLVFRDGGRQYIVEQAQVFIDMMQRTTFSDLGETNYNPNFSDEDDGVVSKKSWLVGHSIVTIETAGKSGRSQITKRQASGTTHGTYYQHTGEIPVHHIPIQGDAMAEVSGDSSQTAMMPSHILLQQIATAAGIASAGQPIPLPENATTDRALKAFDGYNTVDSHGIGLIYIGSGQSQESEILANTTASTDFDQFLASIGTKVSLEGAKFNTHGLNAATDGEYTYAWRDRLTEIVFHVPSMMPTNLENDPQLSSKKRTIGNDFVKIIFNRSNKPFRFETFPTQFNHVNIVITPANKLGISVDDGMYGDSPKMVDLGTSFYKVQCLTNQGIPDISPSAEPKLICGRNLALFVRQIALNAALFALVWQHGEDSAQYTSRWRNRLQEIKRLRERVVREINKKADDAAAEEAAPAQSSSVFGGARISRRGAGERSSLYPEDRELAAVRPVGDLDSVLASGNLVDILDFSKWSS